MVVGLYKHIWCYSFHKRSKIHTEGGGGLTKLTLKNFLTWCAEFFLWHPLVLIWFFIFSVHWDNPAPSYHQLPACCLKCQLFHEFLLINTSTFITNVPCSTIIFHINWQPVPLPHSSFSPATITITDGTWSKEQSSMRGQAYIFEVVVEPGWTS